jgi:hypothetical protein
MTLSEALTAMVRAQEECDRLGAALARCDAARQDATLLCANVQLQRDQFKDERDDSQEIVQEYWQMIFDPNADWDVFHQKLAALPYIPVARVSGGPKDSVTR